MSSPDKRKPASLLATLCFVVASLGAGYLLVRAIQNGPVVGCGTGSSCDSVLKSRWAYLLPGIPVTAPALLTYLVLLFGILFKPGSELWKGIMFVGSLTVIGAAMWFTGVQMVLLKSLCFWCLGIHLVGSIGAVFLIRAISPLPRELTSLGVAGAGMGVAMLAACQFFMPQKATGEVELGKEIVGKLVPIGNDHQLDTRSVPSRGNPESERMLILFFDYTCSSCRRVHEYLNRAEERFGKDSYYLVMVPTPLNPDCNRHYEGAIGNHRNACTFASMALALWAIDREKFQEFDHWMIETGSPSLPPEAEAARAKAEELVGKAALDQALADPQIAAKIEEVSAIWKTLTDQSGMAMPKMLWSNGKLTWGAPRSEFEMFDLMGAQLGLQRVTGAPGS